MKLLVSAAYHMPEQYSSLHLDKQRYRALVDENISVVVYTPMPTRGIHDDVRILYKKRHIESLYGGRMVVHRFNLMREGNNPIARALRYTIGCVKQLFWGIFAKEARTCDVMFISSTPPIQGAMASLIKKVRGIPMIYNLQDIFPDSLVGTGLTKRGSFLWRVGRIIEDFTYRNADKIIVISQDFKRNIMAKGVPEEKIEVIYNWVEEDAVVNVPRTNNKLCERYALPLDKFYITYCGNIGLTQNMDLLLDVAKELEEYQDIQFVLVGEGADKERVKEKITAQHIGNVLLLPFQPYEDISHVFSLGDVSLIISKPGVGENSVPSKTWSIMSAERAVVANFDRNEVEDIITVNKCGIFTQAGDQVSFKNALITLYEDRDLCREMGARGRDFVMKNLTREIGTKKTVNLIKQFERNNK